MQDLNYLFDKNGNVTTLTDNLRSNIRTYTYDELDRLTQAQNVPSPSGGYTNFSYQYDSIGNMTYKSDLGVMSYGQNAGPHALTSAGGFTYSYDANGNMAVGKNKTLGYDIENRLTQVNELGTTSTFTYDGDGGRVRKGLSPQGTDPEQWTVYIGSLYEVDSSGKITKHIFAGANRICTKGLSPEGVLSLSYYHSDHLGSSSIITDSTGQQVAYYEYTPYGTIARNEGTDVVKHKFTGKELDETGLYFYKARYYDPEIGRFITADTIVQNPFNPQTLNRYAYCNNNPINLIDPTGHNWLRDIFKEISRWFGQAERALERATGSEWDINVNVSYSYRSDMPAQAIATVPCSIAIGFSTWLSEPRFKIIDLDDLPSSMESGDHGFINGILNDESAAIEKAIEKGANKILYNPTDGPIADITESFLQKVTFTSSIDRQVANAIKGLNNIRLSGYSQGGIILSNVLINLGLHGRSSVVNQVEFYATQISQPRAYLSAFFAGVSSKHVEYGIHTWDPSNVAGPNLNPIKFGGGLIGAMGGFFGVKYHGIRYATKGQND